MIDTSSAEQKGADCEKGAELKRVIVAGHICLDITPVFPTQNVHKPGDILIPGKLLNVGPAEVHAGGAVVNTGIAMKLMGADVSLMGKIGEDAFGSMVRETLRQYDADRDMLVSPDEDTSYTVVLAMPGIDRIFLHHPGANDTFCASDIPQQALEEAALFHFGYPPLMRSMYEHEGSELVKMMRRVREAGAAASLDLAAVDPASAAGAADWRRILEKVLPYVDIFVPSVEELCYMLDRRRYDEWQARAGDRDITEILDLDRDIRPLADQCMSMGARILMIKCGTPGLYCRTADAAALSAIGKRLALDADAWANLSVFERSYVPDRVLSGTGAGDTCIAAFLAAILRGYAPEMALHLAAAAGALCVAAYDALTGLLPLQEMERRIADGWEKIE